MILEFMYVISGILCVITGIYILCDKDHKNKIASSLFWIIFGFIFIFGPYIDASIVGGLLLVMGSLTLSKKVTSGSQSNSSDEYREEKSNKIGNKIFIPALSIGVVAFLVASFSSLGGLVALGISSFVALLLTLFYTKEKPSFIAYDSSRLLQQMGSSVVLPQLLGALGALFAVAGVGEVVSSIMSNLVPENSKFIGVAIYCIAMAAFTIIMGNAFAAFAVITAGIGIPFVINAGGDAAVVGLLGLSAGYCGTLLTPMAANFNIVPAMILEMNDKNGVIKAQIPVSVALLVTHIFLMYFLAF